MLMINKIIVDNTINIINSVIVKNLVETIKMKTEKIKKYLQESQKDESWQESIQLCETVIKCKELDENTKTILKQGAMIAENDDNTKKISAKNDKRIFSAEMWDVISQSSSTEAKAIQAQTQQQQEVKQVQETEKSQEVKAIESVEKKNNIKENGATMIESMERLKVVFQKKIQDECDEFVANGGKAEDFKPQLIPHGIVYESVMNAQRRKEEQRLKEERSIRNKLKKKFGKKNSAESETKKAEKSTNGANKKQDKKENQVSLDKRSIQHSPVNTLSFENKGEIKNTTDDLAVGDGVGKRENFESYFELGRNIEPNTNKLYDSKRAEWDKRREIIEALWLKNNELRELGIPLDRTITAEASKNFTFKLCASMMLACSLISKDPQWMGAFVASGISMFVGAKCVENNLDLKYRKTVDKVRETYIKSDGIMTADDVRKIMNTHKVELPDKYALASMPKEQRDEFLEQAKNPKELSKRKLIKHIKHELSSYKSNKKKELKKLRKESAKKSQSHSR